MAFLTIQLRGGKRGQARVTPATKVPQTEEIQRERLTLRGRECPRWCSLNDPLKWRRRVCPGSCVFQ